MTVSLGLTSKSVVWVSWFGFKTKVDGFSRFGLKITMTVSLGLTSKSVVCVSWFGFKTKVDGFSRFDLKISGVRFSGLELKTDSYSLMILNLKSPEQFLDLSLKIKCAMIYQWRLAKSNSCTGSRTKNRHG
jgi:hypothetical protein